MAITTTLAACSTNPALNGPDGSVDLPSSLDDAVRYALSFIAQLRDGNFAGSAFIGAVVQFPTPNTPAGWLKLNGQLVSRTTYANLFAFASSIGLIADADFYGANGFGRFSVGDGSTTFRIPDMRAMFPRGLDEGRNIDTGRALGVFQDTAVLTHSHGVTDVGHAHSGGTNNAGGHTHGVNDPGHIHFYGNNNVNAAGGGAGAPSLSSNNQPVTAAVTNISIVGVADHAHTLIVNPATTGLTVNAAGSSEGRPRNMAWPFYIKY